MGLPVGGVGEVRLKLRRGEGIPASRLLHASVALSSNCAAHRMWVNLVEGQVSAIRARKERVRVRVRDRVRDRVSVRVRG